MKKFGCFSAVCLLAVSCTKSVQNTPQHLSGDGLSLQEIAKMISELPLGREQLMEVSDAVSASSGNGYDEEYMMADLISAPGSGVGDTPSAKASRGASYSRPLRSLIEEYYRSHAVSKSGAADVESYLKALSESGLQIYWPFSEDWDGETFPIITFDPGYGAETNYGYEIKMGENGIKVVDSVLVDEKLAEEKPVWVINKNDDSAFTPLEMYTRSGDFSHGTKGTFRMLYLKSFKMLRHYDSWFGGASEFFVKCGSVDGFTARTEAEMKLYSPTVTDFMVVVRRKYKGVDLPVGTIISTNFTNQIESMAFLVTEDDGGTTTSWKCSAVVKVNSKSYGFEMDIPYNDKDDIVWRGQLSSAFLTSSDSVTGRFGDVEITFSLE